MKGFICVIILATVACHSAKVSQTTDNSVHTNAVISDKPIDYSIGPPTVIYKTKSNYDSNVFVILNDDKTKIVSYPAPQDVFYKGQLAYPVKLAKGYLLDNRGAGKNMAFLNMTYEAYSRLTQAPSLDDMMGMIIDKNPITEMYDCGNRYQYKDVVNDLNLLIGHKQLNKFKKVL